MQSMRMPVRTPPSEIKKAPSHGTTVLYVISASAIVVAAGSLITGLLPWHLFGLALPNSDDIVDANVEDDYRTNSRNSSLRRSYRGVDQASKVCQTIACARKGDALFHQLDFHQEPCDDFYAYVCKGWEANHGPPFGAAKVSVDDTLVDDYEFFLADAIQKGRQGYDAVRDIYLKCERPRRADTYLLETLAKFGLHPLPVILKDGITFDGILKDLMTLGVQPLYSLSVERMFENPEQSFLLVGEPKLLMGPLRLGLDLEYAYLESVFSRFVHPIAGQNSTIHNTVFKIEKRMSSFMDRHPEDELGSQQELTDVTKEFPGLARQIRATVAEAFGMDLSKRSIKTASLKYLHAVESGQITRELGHFLNYVAFRAFVELSADNNHDLRPMALAYSRYAGYRSSRPFTERQFCVRMINRYEPSLLMHMTIDAAANKLGGKAAFNSILSLLESVFNDTIYYQTSIDHDFRESLLGSLAVINWEPFVPDAVSLHNEVFRRLRSIYETAAGSNHVIKSFMSLANVFGFWNYAQKDIEKWVGWREGTLDTYAHLESPFLKLEIPLPVFDFSRDPDASLERFRVPRIGPRIYHAMYHAVYHMAYYLGAGGKPVPFASQLHALMDCLGRQYGKLRWGGSRARIGHNSFYSNLFDALALVPTFAAYLRYAEKTGRNERLPKLDLSPRQLFFVEYARNFCENNNATFLNRVLEEGRASPAWYRVNGPLRNFEPFADAFLCKANTFMNPVHRCALL